MPTAIESPIDGQDSLSIFAIVGILVGLLLAGSIVRWIVLRNSDPEIVRQRLVSLKTWWALSLLFSAALLGGKTGICVMLAIVSCIAFFEFDSLLHHKTVTFHRAFHDNRWLIFILILVHYGLVLFNQSILIFVFLPLAGILATTILGIVAGSIDTYVRLTAGRFWGLIVVAYFLSYAGLMVGNGSQPTPWDDQLEWFFYLVLLTEINDISQATVGRWLGSQKRFPLAPLLSPNKTWEGAIGGLVITLLAAVLLASMITSLSHASLQVGSWTIDVPYLPASIAGVLISTGAILGDLNMSGVKRNAQVKDGSQLLPGMGGMIDRIDSLTFTAPIFYLYASWLLVS